MYMQIHIVLYVQIDIEIEGNIFVPVRPIMIIRILRNANMIGARIRTIPTVTDLWNVHK